MEMLIYVQIMVGGGIQSRLLCQLTANACQRQVQAGPVEATVLGNMIGIFNPAFPFLNAAVQANDLYWSSFWLTHLIGWGGIAVSSFYLPYSWMEGSGAWFVRFREKFHNWCLGKMEVRKNFRGALIERNPFYWLVSRSRVTPWLVWGLICIFVVGWFFVEIVARRWIGLS